MAEATKLLIIDDDTHLRESLAEVLELDHFECHQAGNAKEGIEAAKRIEYRTPDPAWRCPAGCRAPGPD